MPRTLFPLALLATGVLLIAVRADDTPGEGAIKEAITVLEARKAQAEKKDDKDKIDRAIADLGTLLPAAKKDGGEASPDLAKLLTPALLKKKLAGKAAFSPKTGELTLVYDFKDKDQLRDFDLGDWKPKLNRGVGLQAGESIKHVVTFETCHVTCVLAVQQANGTFVKFGNVAVVTDNDGSSRHLKVGAESLTQQTGSGADFAGVWTLDLNVEAKKTTVKLGQTVLGKPAVAKPGNLEVGGGNGGATFGKITLTGKLDEAWAKAFFKE